MNNFASGKQLHLIASLSQSLGIHTPVEENILTAEAAGKMIRRLLNEQQFRQQHSTSRRHGIQHTQPLS